MWVRKNPVENLPSILTDIIGAKRKRLDIQKYHMPMAHFSDQLNERSSSEKEKGFLKHLRGQHMAVIAEVKKASPSKGVLAEDFNPEAIALQYENRGASAISVLTEEDYFLGSPQVLERVKTVTHCPILRKDFIIDPYQIYESAVIGADAILLIARILDLKTLKEMMALSQSLGLEVLLEIHDLPDLEKAIEAQAKIIGVNNRDLNTFQVSLENSLNLSKDMPKEALWISESGIKSPEDVRLLKGAGFSGVLIGETLMKSPQALEELIQI